VATLGPAGCSERLKHVPARLVDLRVESTNCHLHGTLLRDELVETTDGHASYSGGYYRDRTRLFPLACQELVPGNAGEVAIIRYCPQCRVAHEQWAQSHDPLDDFRLLIEEAAAANE
jgi:hypothetical protein